MMARDDIDDVPPDDGWRDTLPPEPASAVVHRAADPIDVPPHDIEAEGAMLGACILTPERLPDVLAVTQPSECYADRHSRIYGALKDLHEAGDAIDIVQVASALKRAGRLEQVGGMAYLVDLLNVATIGNPVAYARTVHDHWRTRSFIASCQALAAHGYHSSEPVDVLLARAQEQVATLMASGPATGLPTLDTRDLSEELPELPWLVPSLGMAPGAPIIVAGYGYSRKTLAMQSLALSVASGKPVWGLYACRKGPVVHLDYEQGRRLTQERYQRMARGMGFELASLGQDALRVAVMPRLYLDGQGAREALLRACKGAALVVIDSLRAACPSADENSSEVRSHLDMLGWVSERTGATFVVIHHAKKPSKDDSKSAKFALRGSSALFDGCSGIFVFEGEKGEPTTVHHEKERNRGQCIDDFGLDAEDIAHPATGKPNWALRVVHLEGEQVQPAQSTSSKARFLAAIEKIYAVIGTNPGASKRLVRELAGLKNDTVDEGLSQLLKVNRIVNRGDKNGASYHVA